MNKLGGSRTLCTACGKTAYPKESQLWDGMTWHTKCFRCEGCKTRVSIRGVAMLQKQLWCKNCFIRVFTEKGNYDSFGEDTLPKHRRSQSAAPKLSPTKDKKTAAAAVAASGPPVVEEEPEKEKEAASSAGKEAAKPASDDAAAADAGEDKKEEAASGGLAVPSPSKGKRGSVFNMCSVAKCSMPRVASTEFCSTHTEDEAAEAPAAAAGDGGAGVAAYDELVAAVRARDVAATRRIVGEHGVSLVFKVANKKTVIELAFTELNSAACGNVLMAMVAERFRALEDGIASFLRPGNDNEDDAPPAEAEAEAEE